jgi:hypothetical protein
VVSPQDLSFADACLNKSYRIIWKLSIH